MSDERSREELEAALARSEARAAELEARLERSERVLADLGDVPYTVTVPDGRFVHMGAASQHVFGVPAQRFLERPLLVRELLSDEDRDRFDAVWRRAKTGVLPSVVEYRIPEAHGEVRWVRQAQQPVFDASGRIVAVEGICRDITAAKRATEALFEEKEQLLTTLDSIADGVIATDIEGRITLMNPEAERLTGWSWEQAEGRALVEVYSALDEHTRAPRAELVAQVVESGEAAGPTGAAVLICPDGSERLLDELAAPIVDASEQVRGVVLVFRDETANRRLEEQTLRTQKLEALGVLAGGIAHDFNNILTGVMGNVSLARLQIAEDDPAAPRLSEAERALQRARGLTQQLLTFARGGTPVMRPTAVGCLVEEAVTFGLAGSNVGCQLDIPDDLWPVRVDEAQIGRVLQNLVLNAEEAMPDGGTVLVTVSNRAMGPGNDHNLVEGRYVRIGVEDHGMGIDPAVLTRIFEPYFTTKEHGSGLGLSVCYSIVDGHQGALVVESEPEKGSCFFVYLPAADEDIEEVSDVLPSVLQGTGRVLVVDDEAMVRDVACAMLLHLGYRPVAVADGAEAIERYGRDAQAGKPFDAVVMDLTIPGGMGGQEAVQWLLSLDPDLRCIVSSGYSDDPVMAEYRRWGFRGVMRKPYRMDELSRALEDVLAQPPEGEE